VTFSRKAQTSGNYTEDMNSLLLILEANKRKKKMLRKQNVTLKATLEHVMVLVSKNIYVASDSEVEDASDADERQQEQKNNENN
jgi:hypothetical protein